MEIEIDNNGTWVKLDANAKANDIDVTLTEAVTGWRVGDKLIITATQLSPGGSTRRGPTDPSRACSSTAGCAPRSS